MFKTQSIKLKKKAAKRKIHNVGILKKMSKNMVKTQYAPRHASLWFRFFLVTLAALIVTFALDLFIHPAKLYSGGLRGVQQIILYSVPAIEENPWAGYLIFFAINLPLAYFGFKYVGFYFTILSLYFILIQSLFSFLFQMDSFKNNVQAFRNIMDLDYLIQTGQPKGIPKSMTHDHIKAGMDALQTFRSSTDRYIAALIGSVIYGSGISLAFIAGGSSAGSKFIVAYISNKFGKSLGKIGIYIAMVVVTMGIIVNSIIIGSPYKDATGELHHSKQSFLNAFLSIKMFATILYIAIQNIVINVMVPRTKKTKIEIQTKQYEKVRKIILGTILDKRRWYSFDIKKNMNKEKSAVFVLIVDKREAKYVVNKVHKQIPQAYVIASDVTLKTKTFTTRSID